MIIKVMDKNMDYWMCDNVESVEVRYFKDIRVMTATEAMGIQGSPTRKVIFSVHTDYSVEPTKQKECSIDLKLKNDNERYTVLFNTVAFICNDEGKTIERVVG